MPAPVPTPQQNPFSGGSQLVAPDGIKLPVAPVLSPPGNIGGSDRGFFFPLSAVNGSFTYQLPNPAIVQGQPLFLKKVDPSFNSITIIPFAAETIDNGATFVLSNQFQSVMLVSDGTNWNVVTNYLNPTVGVLGLGVAGSLALWSTPNVLTSTSLITIVGTTVNIPNLNVPGTLTAQTALVGGVNVGPTIQTLQAQIADLNRRYRLLLKALWLGGVNVPAIAGQAPYLVQAELPLALTQN